MSIREGTATTGSIHGLQMDYEGLTASYWHQQVQRVESLRLAINDRSRIRPGLVVPENDDLVIGSGRRLNLAVLFLDISAFSARRSFTEGEQATTLRVLSLFFSEMVKVAEDYGGVVEKNTGDGLFAYFVDGPPPSPTASQKAVAASLTMFASNDHLVCPTLRNSAIEPLKFRVSIDYGPVTIAKLGAARRFNSMVAIGVPANFASKMLKNAQADELVLGEQARLQLPLAWQTNYTELAMGDTGWTYAVSGRPYLLYRYTGRWSRLI